MRAPKGWRVSVGDGPASVIVEFFSCRQAWSWLTKPQRAALRGADESGWVEGRVIVLRHLREHGLITEADMLTAAGRLVLAWNDEEGGAWRERLQELRAEMKSG